MNGAELRQLPGFGRIKSMMLNRTKLVALPAGATMNELRDTLTREPAQRGQHLYPVVDDERRVNGVITRKQLRELAESAVSTMSLSDVLQEPVLAYP